VEGVRFAEGCVDVEGCECAWSLVYVMVAADGLEIESDPRCLDVALLWWCGGDVYACVHLCEQTSGEETGAWVQPCALEIN